MTTPGRLLPTWARILIGLLSAAIAAFGMLPIVTQHHVGRTRAGKLVESTGAAAVGMGVFYLGSALLLAALVMPHRNRKPTLIAGAVVMVAGIAGALLGR